MWVIVSAKYFDWIIFFYKAYIYSYNQVRDELKEKETKSHEETMTRKEFEDKQANLSCITAKLPGDPDKRPRRSVTISDDFQEL